MSDCTHLHFSTTSHPFFPPCLPPAVPPFLLTFEQLQIRATPQRPVLLLPSSLLPALDGVPREGGREGTKEGDGVHDHPREEEGLRTRLDAFSHVVEVL